MARSGLAVCLRMPSTIFFAAQKGPALPEADYQEVVPGGFPSAVRDG